MDFTPLEKNFYKILGAGLGFFYKGYCLLNLNPIIFVISLSFCLISFSADLRL